LLDELPDLPTRDRHSRIWCLEAVLLCDRIEIGRGNVSTHIESPDPQGLRWTFRLPPELIMTCTRFLIDHVRVALQLHRHDHQRCVAVPNAVDIDCKA